MSEDIVRGMSQIEGQVGSVNERVSAVSAKVDPLAASFASVKDVVLSLIHISEPTRPY